MHWVISASPRCVAGLGVNTRRYQARKPIPKGTGLNFGSGGVICTVPTVTQRIRLK